MPLLYHTFVKRSTHSPSGISENYGKTALLLSHLDFSVRHTKIMQSLHAADREPHWTVTIAGAGKSKP